MCLSSITERGGLRAGYGWKVFDIIDGKLRNVYYSQYKVTVNKWLVAKRTIVKSPSLRYMSGFHIFTHKPKVAEAIDITGMGKSVTVIKKVKYKRGCIVGTWCGEAVVVADEMLVLPVRKVKKGGD